MPHLRAQAQAAKPLAKDAQKQRPKDFDPRKVAAEQDVHGTLRKMADDFPNARLVSRSRAAPCPLSCPPGSPPPPAPPRGPGQTSAASSGVGSTHALQSQIVARAPCRGETLAR